MTVRREASSENRRQAEARSVKAFSRVPLRLKRWAVIPPNPSPRSEIDMARKV